MTKLLVPALLAAWLASGCGKSDETESTTAILRQAAEDKYNPPADNRITEEQMKLYLAVRKRELEIARAAAVRLHSKSEDVRAQKGKPGLMDGVEALREVGRFLKADVRAAKELGYNGAEYQWVRGQVLEATSDTLAEGFRQATARTIEESIQYYREQLARAETADEKQLWRRNIDALAGQHAEMQRNENMSDAVRHNREIIRKYQGELGAIKSEMDQHSTSGDNKN